MHVESVKFLFRKIFQRDGIVQVFGIFSVDGNRSERAEISSCLRIQDRLRHFHRNRSSLSFYFLRKVLGKRKCPNDGEHIHARLRTCAEHLRNTANRIGEKGTPLSAGDRRTSPTSPFFLLLHSAVGEDFCHDLIPRKGSTGLSGLNIEGRGELYIVRIKEEPLASFFHKSEDFRYRTLHDLNDFSLGTGITLLFLCDKDLYGVSVHGISFRTLRDVNVIEFLFREAHKAEAFFCLGINPL